MSRIVACAGIVLGAIALILLYPTFAYIFYTEPKVETFNEWTKAGDVTVANHSTTISVNATSRYSSISKKINVSSFQTVILTWVDSANVESATYEVRVIQGDRIIVSVLKTSDSADWLTDKITLKIPHSKTVEVPAGEYTILYSLQGSKGNVKISEVSVSNSVRMWLVRRIDALAPFLIVLAIGGGVAASTSTISSLKKDVERLKTLLSLKG